MRRAAVALALALLANGIAHAIPIPGSWCDGSAQTIDVIGSTLQDPLHQRLFIPEYEAACNKAAGQVRHLRLGQDAAFTALQEHNDLYPLLTVDRPLSSSEKVLAEQDLPARRGRFSLTVHLPLFVTPLAVVYNQPCPGLPRLKIGSATLSLIYSGAVLRWNDPLLVRDNPALANCATTVKVATRVEASASTDVLKDYLSKRNPQWTAFKQPQLSTQWPSPLIVACQGLGEEGMIACVTKSPGYVGYATWATMLANPGLKSAAVDDSQGDFTEPSTAGCTAAAQDAFDRQVIPRDSTLDWGAASLTDSTTGYPICNMSYFLAYQWQVSAYFGAISAGRQRTIRDFVDVTLKPATQAKLTAQGYAPLPAAVLAVSRQGWSTIEFA